MMFKMIKINKTNIKKVFEKNKIEISRIFTYTNMYRLN